MQTVLSRILLIFLLIGVLIFMGFRLSPQQLKQSVETYSTGYGWPYELPPLNYYTGTERDILSFWYDPVIDGEDHKDRTWGFSQELPPGYETNIDEVFGPANNLQRYNIEDIDASQPE
jgi:hypothetical protein